MTAIEELAIKHPPRTNQERVWVTRLQELRKRKGLPLRLISDTLKISLGYLSQLEHGRNDPSLSMAAKIAAFFGVTIEEIWVRRVRDNDAPASLCGEK